MRKSKMVVVTLIGSLGMTACYDGHAGTVYKSQYVRESYRSLDECQKAWGKTDNTCVRSSSSGSSYYGPYHGSKTSGGNVIFYSYNSNGSVASTAYTKSYNGTSKSTVFRSAPGMNGRFATSSTARGGFGATASGKGGSFSG